MTSDYIVEVNEADFEYEVLAFSSQMPVVVDFWAEWCIPCRTLGPILERLAEAGEGAFRLAKVNVDQNVNLARRYNVRSIPAVKAFRDGQLVSEFTGNQPEPRVEAFIAALAPTRTALALEKGQSLLQLEQPESAELAFREVLEENPEHPAALLGLVRSLLLQARGGESLFLLHNFPDSRELASAQRITPLAEALVEAQSDEVQERLFEYDLDPLEAAYFNALRLFERGFTPAALDGLLDILRQDKHYRDDQVRKVVLGVLEILGDENPLAVEYRKELAMIIF